MFMESIYFNDRMDKKYSRSGTRVLITGAQSGSQSERVLMECELLRFINRAEVMTINSRSLECMQYLSPF